MPGAGGGGGGGVSEPILDTNPNTGDPRNPNANPRNTKKNPNELDDMMARERTNY